MLLNYIWRHREDWFFSGDMGIYHTTGANPRLPVIPDAFLSIGFEHWSRSPQGREITP
jgi:hypothetical protein